MWMHWRAARAFIEMVNAAAEAGFTMRANNALRRIKWETKAEFEAALRKKYPKLTLREAKRRLGWKGPHNLGLAVDIGAPFPPWTPAFAWKAKQQAHPMYDWLIDNAALFGFTPYNYEPWHWEFYLSKEDWLQLPDNSGTYHPPQIARAKTMANYSRRNFQQGVEAENTNTTAQNLLTVATNTQIIAEISLDTIDELGLLYDFNTGKWNDSAT